MTSATDSPQPDLGATPPALPSPTEGGGPSGPWGLARLMVRLVVDAAATVAMAVAIVALPAALAALMDIARVGFAGLPPDVLAAREAIGRLPPDTLSLLNFAVGLLMYLAVILALLGLARLRRGANWRAYLAWRGFRPDRVYWALLAVAVALGVCAGGLIEYLDPDLKNLMVFPKGLAGAMVTFVLAVLLGPVCEELFFRGWLYTALRPTLGFIATLALTATLFAVAHWEGTHLYALAVFPLGLIMGYIRERSGSAKASAAFHAFYNLSAWLLTLVTNH